MPVRPTHLGTSERDSLERYVTRLRQQFHVQIRDADLPRLRPWLAGIIVADRGDLWLMDTHSAAGTTFHRYDPTGRPLGQAQAAIRIRSFPAPQVVGRDLWAVVANELDVPCLARFEVP